MVVSAVLVLVKLFFCGYAGIGTCVFGKQEDGKIPVWSKIIHLPYMLYSAILWHLVCLLSREQAINNLTDNIIIGRRLLTHELPEGITNYVDLTAEMEDPKAIRELPGYLCLPILDAGIPSSEKPHSAISRLKPGKIFIHCAQGHGRTGLFALTLLVEHQQIHCFDEGLAMIQSIRPKVKLRQLQEKFMRHYISEFTQI